MDEFTDKLPVEYEKFIGDINDIIYYADFEVNALKEGSKIYLDTYYIGDESRKHPDLYLAMGENHDGTWYVEPTLSFPDLKFSEMSYADDFHYWMQEWADIGKVMTNLCKYSFNPDEYLEDLANGEYD